jgi:thiosulfate dehydrogenase [quinone] large subunit
MSKLLTHENVQVSDPVAVQQLFGNTRFAWVWLLARLAVGALWLSSGLGKVINPAWVSTGAALKNSWTNMVAVTPRPVAYYDWYRSFLQYLLDTESYTWFAKLIAYGEVLVGIALILGIFTGIAAFFGGFMNWNFMMAGTASSNPMMFVVTISIILAWKIAGYWGLDRFLLPALGTPWKPAFHLNGVNNPAAAPAKA